MSRNRVGCYTIYTIWDWIRHYNILRTQAKFRSSRCALSASLSRAPEDPSLHRTHCVSFVYCAFWRPWVDMTDQVSFGWHCAISGREEMLGSRYSLLTSSYAANAASSLYGTSSLFPNGTTLAVHSETQEQEGQSFGAVNVQSKFVGAVNVPNPLFGAVNVPYALSPMTSPDGGTNTEKIGERDLLHATCSTKSKAPLYFDSPSSRMRGIGSQKLPRAGLGQRKGVAALGTLSLSARVYLRLCLALPPHLAASLIQVLSQPHSFWHLMPFFEGGVVADIQWAHRSCTQAWWRGYAVRRVLPVLLLHAHRVCGIVERHRKRLVHQAHPPDTPDCTPIAMPAQVHETLLNGTCAGRDGQGTHSLQTATRQSQVSACTVQGYTTAHAQAGLKRKLALSWSAKRITYPLCIDLSSTVPYLSAPIDVTVCLCFVSNFISFHIAERIGGVGSDDSNPTAQTTLALKRLHSIVEDDQKLLVTRVQQRYRGWRVRKSIFGALPEFHYRNTYVPCCCPHAISGI